MALPRLMFQVGFTASLTGSALILGDPVRGLLGTATLGPADIWTDITPWVRNWSMRRGASRVTGPNADYDAGTLTVELNNGDRRFDPTNLSGPYALDGESQVEPMRAIRLLAVWDGSTYELWRGFTDTWRVAYQPPSWSTTTLTCTDAFKVFANYDRDPSAPGGAGESSGERVNRILDSVGWPDTDRVIATGDTVLQATTLEGPALSELRLVADTELGEFYMDAAGRAVFRNRAAAVNDTRSSVPQAKFGDLGVITVPVDTPGVVGFAVAPDNPLVVLADLATPGVGVDGDVLTIDTVLTSGVSVDGDTLVVTLVPVDTAFTLDGDVVLADPDSVGLGTDGDVLTVNTDTATGITMDGDVLVVTLGSALVSTSPELPYADVELVDDDLALTNLISITRVGGVPQVVQNAASRFRYLTRTYRRDDLLMTTDGAASAHASAVASLTANPKTRFDNLLVLPLRDPVSLFPQILTRELGDRITVVRRPPGGGSPIERDVFIRGIEHVSDGEDWRTRYVLQTAARDSFFVLGDSALGLLGTGQLGY